MTKKHNQAVVLNAQVIGEGFPLLAIHGVFGSGDNWRLLSHLPYQLHLLDMRNHGHSPHHQDVSLSAMSQDVLHYLECKGLEKVHLLGHSMGARVAMFLAMNCPHRVDKLIVVDMAPRDYPPTMMGIFKVMEKVALAKPTHRQQADDILATEVQEVAVRQFLLKSLKRSPDGKLVWKIAWQYLRDGAACWGHSPVLEGQTYDGLGAFIYGMESEYVSLTDHPMMHRHFPYLQIIGIDGAGHWLHTQQPELFLRELQHILGE